MSLPGSTFLKRLKLLRYNRFVGLAFLTLEKYTGFPREKKRFLQKKGYKPNLTEPLTLSEKLMWKKIHDRNPILPVTADKFRARSYLEEVLGPDRAAEILIPLLYATDRPETIPYEELPDRFIVKANHASGFNMVVDKKVNRKEEVINCCRGWLKMYYGLYKNEWAYVNIKPMVIIEKLLLDQEGSLPKNYKFFMFHRNCRYIRIANNLKDLPSSSYTPEWHYLPLLEKGKKGPEVERPKRLEEMLDLARTLSNHLDFVRVDLYYLGDKIFFSELTHYPNSAKLKIPYCLDLELGQYLNLAPGYWQKGNTRDLAAKFNEGDYDW